MESKRLRGGIGARALFAAGALLAAGSQAGAQEINMSGLAYAGENTFLVASDVKVAKDHPRLRLLGIGDDGFELQTLELQGLPDEQRTNDLESAYPVPGAPGEFLIAESGFTDGNFGRVFHIRVVVDPPSATLIGTFQPVPLPTPGYSTPSEHQFEGTAAVRASDGRLIVLFGERGGVREVGTGSQPGVLLWGVMRAFGSASPTWEKLGEAPLTDGEAPLGDRGAADLRLQEVGTDRWAVLAVATVDVGDFGAWRSVIYRAGIFDATGGGARFERQPPVILWRVDGLKIESMADPAPIIAGSALSIGTDDEAYDGIFRGLTAPQVPCCGDCNGDTQVTIDELVRAVNRSLDGCSQEP